MESCATVTEVKILNERFKQIYSEDLEKGNHGILNPKFLPHSEFKHTLVALFTTEKAQRWS